MFDQVPTKGYGCTQKLNVAAKELGTRLDRCQSPAQMLLLIRPIQRVKNYRTSKEL